MWTGDSKVAYTDISLYL
jgi:mannosyl-oligosaccharide alpha-1,3-glucosidase